MAFLSHRRRLIYPFRFRRLCCRFQFLSRVGDFLHSFYSPTLEILQTLSILSTLLTNSASNYASYVLASLLHAELVLLHNALFTEPDDQSPWIYRRWVIENVISWCEIVYATTLAANNGAEGAAISFGMPSTPIEKDDNANPSLYLASLALSALLYDKNQIQLLYSVSSDSKWVLEALAHLTRRMEAKCYLEIYRQSPYFAVAEAETSAAPEGNEKAAPPSPDARKLNIQSSDVAWLASLGDTPKEGDHTSSLYSKLATIDPLHKEYYAYQLAMRYV